MITRVDHTAGEFQKQAETPDEVDRLRHEAQVLGIARHPGVVQLLGIEGETLRFRLVDGDRLGDLPTAAPDELATAAATTLADLHDIGVAHRAIRPEHLLVDRFGQPILCGFGHAAAGDKVGDNDQSGDVAALARTLLASPATIPIDSRQHRILTKAAQAGGRGPSARRLATLLAASPATVSSHHRGPLIVGAVVLAAAITALATIVVVRPLVDAPPAPTGPANTAACPAIDRGCQPVPRPGGILKTAQGRYRIGQPGDLVVVGRWQCAAALPALLQPATGDVWVWSSWAGRANPLEAHLVTRVPSAESVQVDPGPSGCDQLRVLLPGGSAVVVQPAGNHPGRAA